MSDDVYGPDEVAAATTLAELAATDAPADLRDEVLAAALDRRPSGTSVDAAAPSTPLATYRGLADALHALLQAVPDQGWDAPAHAQHGSVREVVAHLAGIEQVALTWIGADPEPAGGLPVDHYEATRGAVAALASATSAEVVARWHALTERVVDACVEAGPERPVVAHDIPTDVDGMLVLRAFELWAHTEDVAAALGRPAPRPDASQLALMSTRLIAVLPWAMALRGTSAPGRTARLVLTGAGGGTYDVALDPGDEPGPPDVTVVAHVAELCLVAARRLSPADATIDVDGDQALADRLLAAVDAFARD